jgi:hypothetical protein
MKVESLIIVGGKILLLVLQMITEVDIVVSFYCWVISSSIYQLMRNVYAVFVDVHIALVDIAHGLHSCRWRPVRLPSFPTQGEPL